MTSSLQRFFRLCFKMLKRFVKLDNTLMGERKNAKKFCRCIKQVRGAGREEKKRFFLRKWFRKNTRAVSVGSRARLNQKQN